MENLPRKKVFMYCRGSKAQQVLTLSKQQQFIEARVRSKIKDEDLNSMYGFDLIPCIEGGVSAGYKFSNRPMGQRILQECSPGDVIAVHKLDRIFRSVIDMSNTMDLFERMGLRFICCEPDLDIHQGTSAFTKFVMQIMTAVAELERCMVAERTKHSLEESLRKGTYRRGRAPMGWKRVKHKGKKHEYHVDNIERKMLSEEVLPRLQEGESCFQIEQESRIYERLVRPASGSHLRIKQLQKLHWTVTHGFPKTELLSQYEHLIKPAWTTNIRYRPDAPAVGIDPDTEEPVKHTLQEEIEMFFEQERREKLTWK